MSTAQWPPKTLREIITWLSNCAPELLKPFRRSLGSLNGVKVQRALFVWSLGTRVRHRRVESRQGIMATLPAGFRDLSHGCSKGVSTAQRSHRVNTDCAFCVRILPFCDGADALRGIAISTIRLDRHTKGCSR